MREEQSAEEHPGTGSLSAYSTLTAAPTPPAPAPAAAQPQPEGWCAKHGVPMTQNHKEGRAWYSHKTAEGWCKGK